MPEEATPRPTKSNLVLVIDPKWRWLAGFLGICGLAAGGIATFTTDVEGGPVALILVGLIFTFVAMVGRLPNRVKIGENEAVWEQIGEYVEGAIARATPSEKAAEIDRALELAEVAPEAVARAIGKTALRDASLALVREAASSLPDVHVRELTATVAGEVMIMIERTDGARILVDALAPDQDAMTAEPIADMPLHWGVLFLIGRSNQVRFDLDTERPSAAFVYQEKDRYQRDGLRDLLLSMLRESRKLLTSDE